jgi:vacuolar-type H+-ATPase subunit E/Vma4
MNSELIKVIEKEAEAERQRILENSQNSAREMVEKARTEAAEMERRSEEELRSTEATEMAKAASAANLQAMAIMLEAKSAIVDSIFKSAYESIKKTPAEKYKKVLKLLLDEASEQLPGETVVLAGQGDLKMVQDLVKAAKMKAEVKPDPRVQEGLIMTDKSGSYSILNRFSDRLERARPSLISRISEILWG